MSEEGHRITEEMLVRSIADAEGIPGQDASELGKRIQILDFDVSEGSSKGDNFVCIMKAVTMRARVAGAERTFAFMAKCAALNPVREEFAMDSGMFPNELLFYCKLAPAYRRILGGKYTLAVPRCHFATVESKVILMENLKKQGYVMFPRKEGLPLGTAKLVLTELAVLHAASFHFLHTYPGGMDAARTDLADLFHGAFVPQKSQKETDFFDTFQAGMAKAASAIITKKDKELGRKLSQFLPKFKDAFYASCKPVGKFNVILHGDTWNNNFMFLKDEAGVPVSARLVDLQIVRYASAVHDLNYFFFTSVTPAMRANHLKDLLKHYHTKVMQVLTDLGHPEDTYTFEALCKDFDDCFPFGFAIGMTLTQIVTSEAATADGGSFDLTQNDTREGMLASFDELEDKLTKEEDVNTELEERLAAIARQGEARGII